MNSNLYLRKVKSLNSSFWRPNLEKLQFKR